MYEGVRAMYSDVPSICMHTYMYTNVQCTQDRADVNMVLYTYTHTHIQGQGRREHGPIHIHTHTHTGTGQT
jgi:hypothetical protein